MAGSFLNRQHTDVRPARAEQLPDGRKRLTRYVSFKQNSEFPAEMGGTVATSTDAASNWSSPPSGWSDLYLISATTDTSLSPNGSGNNPVTILTYESAGTIAQTDETKNNGALLIRTIRTAHTAPATPSGYTLIQTADDNPNGFDTFTYTFAKGDGQISQTDETRNNGALLLRTIRYITVPGTLGVKGSSPISTPVGYTLINENYAEQDGHRIWTATYAQGSGEIGRDISYRQSSDQGTTGVTITTIRHLVADEGTVQPTSLSGSVEIGRDYVDQDGHRIWTTTWAKGTGLVVDDKSSRSLGNLILYRRVALGAIPDTPAATVGGTVKRIDDNVRKEAGFDVYERTWAEAKPNVDVGVSVTARPDGSLVYVNKEFNETAVTPSYPGTGTAYLVDLDQQSQDGYYVNVATYIKPPATVTLTKMRQVRMPGEAEFETTTGGHNLLLTSESNRLLKCSVEVSYATTQLTDTPWKVDYGTTYRASYTRTGQTVAEYEQQVMPFFLASSDSVSGTDDTYNGVACSSYSASLTASSPTALPTGATVLDIDHDVYLTAIDGTVVYRRTKVSYTF